MTPATAWSLAAEAVAGTVTPERQQSQRVSLAFTAVTAVTACDCALRVRVCALRVRVCACACARARARARVERNRCGKGGKGGNRYELICSSHYNHRAFSRGGRFRSVFPLAGKR
jgi:hypothetical protein